MINFFRPVTVKQVSELLDKYQEHAQLIAGGTDLLLQVRQRNRPLSAYLIDLTRVEGMNEIIADGEQIMIGAAVTHDQIVRSQVINKDAPLLATACRSIGSQQIRNRGTLGGNICNASPCADSIPPLFVLEAQLNIIKTDSRRTVPISEFFSAPYQTILHKGEWLHSIIIKKLDQNCSSAFLKLGRRNAVAVSRINLAAVLKLSQEGLIEEARLTPGSVFPVWRRIPEIENFLLHKKASLPLFEASGKRLSQIMVEVSGRRWSTPYKEPVVAALLKRVLCAAAKIDG